jgi:hypothetical protein
MMIAMSSLGKREIKEQHNAEICRLRKGFKALTIDHQKGVLKTAKGLLRIQRAHKTMAADNMRRVDFSIKDRNGNKTQ